MYSHIWFVVYCEENKTNVHHPLRTLIIFSYTLINTLLLYTPRFDLSTFTPNFVSIICAQKTTLNFVHLVNFSQCLPNPFFMRLSGHSFSVFLRLFACFFITFIVLFTRITAPNLAFKILRCNKILHCVQHDIENAHQLST